MKTQPEVKISGPCTCYVFWLLLAARNMMALFDHMKDCPYCQWWHNQPLPDLPERMGE